MLVWFGHGGWDLVKILDILSFLFAALNIKTLTLLVDLPYW